MSEQVTITPLALSREESAVALGLSLRAFDRLRQSQAFGPRPVKLGRVLRWSSEELAAWVRAGCPNRIEWAKQWEAGK